VLERLCHETVGFQFEDLARAVLCPDLDPRRAFYVLGEIRDAETALLATTVPSRETTSGLIRTTRGAFLPLVLVSADVDDRDLRGTPTWLAARPTPGAAYMVSTMSSIRRRGPRR